MILEMSEQKPSHEVEGTVRIAPRQECVQAQIWRSLPKNVCSIEGPQEIAKRYLKDSQTMINKILWTHETKIELFGLNASRLEETWHLPIVVEVSCCGDVFQRQELGDESGSRER